MKFYLFLTILIYQNALGSSLVREEISSTSQTITLSVNSTDFKSTSEQGKKKFGLKNPAISGAVGNPQVLQVTELISLGSQSSTQLSVSTTGKVELSPVQMQTVPPMHYELSKVPVKSRQPKLSSSNQNCFGCEPAKLKGPVWIGPALLYPLTLTASRYEPNEQKLTFFKEVKVHLDGDESSSSEPIYLTDFQFEQVKSLTQNTFSKNLKKLNSTSQINLVITGEELSDMALKTAGLNRDDETVRMEILPKASSPEKVKEIILSYYSSGNLNSVLFFGNEKSIPLYYYQPSEYFPLGIPSDTWYSFLQGEDDFSDIALGRIPVENNEQARTIYKRMRAHKTQETQSIVGKIAMVAHWDKQNYSYEFNQNSVLALGNPRKFSYKKIYGSQGSKNETLVNFLANEHVAVVNYRGHGEFLEWSHWSSDFKSFNDKTISKLVGNFFPVYFNIACRTGGIHVEAPTLAESLLVGYQDGGGAVAVLASTEESTTEGNDIFNKELWKAMSTETKTTLGHINALVGHKLILAFGGDELLENVQMSILLGDPLLTPLLNK